MAPQRVEKAFQRYQKADVRWAKPAAGTGKTAASSAASTEQARMMGGVHPKGRQSTAVIMSPTPRSSAQHRPGERALRLLPAGREQP